MKASQPIYLGLRSGYHCYRLRYWIADSEHPKSGRQASETFRVKAKGSGRGIKAAQRKLDDLRVSSRMTTDYPRDLALRGLWERWSDFLVKGDRVSPLHLENTTGLMENVVLPKLGDVPIADLTTARLDRFYSDQLARGLAPRTVQKYHRVLSSMFHQAERWKLIASAPTRDASPPPVPRHEIQPPSLDLIRTVQREVEKIDPAIGLFVSLSSSTGARRGEVCGLRWPDIDYKARKLTISRSVYKLAGRDPMVKPTKTDRPRSVSLPSTTITKLLRAMEETPDAKGYIFSEDGKTPWNPDRVTLAFRRARNKVPGAGNVRLHDLRHAHATHLLDAGVNIVTVSKRLGHSNVSTTSDIYAHALELRDREAADIAGTWDDLDSDD